MATKQQTADLIERLFPLSERLALMRASTFRLGAMVVSQPPRTMEFSQVPPWGHPPQPQE